MVPTPSLQNIAIVGTSGHIGNAFAQALLETGKHTITALVRAESKGTPPEGVKTAHVDFDSEDSLVVALTGQQFLAITLSAVVPKDLHTRIVQAAVKAGVQYIMPNAYGDDIEHSGLQKDELIGKAMYERCQEVRTLGASYVAMVCGVWYQWSLALGEAFFGIDIQNRKAILFDDGKKKINSSTWEQCGRALAALLSLPESGASPSVSDWKNKPLFVSSFFVSQTDMLDSLNRVLGTTVGDWEIEYVPSEKRYVDGLAQLQGGGGRPSLARALYAKIFYPDGWGDYQSVKGLANGVLGLPEENLDRATKEAVDMVESGWTPWE